VTISANQAAHVREVLEINQYSIVVFIVNDALAIGAHKVTDATQYAFLQVAAVRT
jgi:hypothetical protein